MEFVKRITPEKIQRYEPIRKERFQPPLAIYILGPLLQFLNGSKTEQFLLLKDGQATALGTYTYRTRSGGLNYASLQVDPACPELAPVAINHLLSSVQKKSLGRRLEINLKNWQPALLQAAEAVDCTRRYTFSQMAICFNQTSQLS
jgi:hypothetical protein